MLNSLFKGIFLLSGIAGGIFFAYANGLSSLVDQSTVKPIVVSDSSRLNQKSEGRLKGVLFGNPKTIKLPITETSLGFALKGTIPSSNTDNSLAIIQFKSKKERVIAVGEELIGGVLLISVFNDYVVISRNGKQEKISFPVVNKNSLVVSKKESTSLTADSDVSTTQIQNTVEIKNTTQVQGSGQRNKDLQPLSTTFKNIAQSLTFDMYEKALEASAETVLNQAGLSVADSGLKVSANSALVGLGLQQGDTVLSVNGISASQLVSDTSAMSDIKQSGDAAVLVRRGSETLTVNIKF